MTLLALALVLVAAVVHATWNLLAKRAGGDATFVWLYGIVAIVLYAPLAIPVLLRNWAAYGALHWAFMTGSGLIHMAYFVLLQRAYRTGDLSVVYPMARGTGPMLASLAAIALLAERPTVLAMTGAALICFSIFLFARPASGASSHGVAFGAGIGLLIAVYTVWDKYAVSTLRISPIALEWVTTATRVVLLAPVARPSAGRAQAEWRAKRKYVLWIGALNPLAYILVLLAMSFTALTYVAPAREVSILIGAYLGARFLGEGGRQRRLVASAIMVAGVIALALG